MSIQFRPITTEDLPLLHEWLNRPHVAERWDRPMPVAEVESHYTPCIDGTDSRMVRAFIEKLFEDDPAVTRIQTDPSPTNARAIRCYEKAGFRRIRGLDTPDGPALLMYCDRLRPS